jgi:anaerobic magnesium-protoporphyrin IX monomethyl ester cyclase
MDILLTHGYFLYEDPKELQIMKPYPPLGILYICSHLRQKGLNAEVFDSTFSSRQQLWDLLKQGPPSILGIYANLMTRSSVVEILGVAKRSQVGRRLSADLSPVPTSTNTSLLELMWL